MQFGDIFGVFRLLEDDNALPMTQAIEIPETPVVAYKNVTKLHKAPTTLIPESPDVSDRVCIFQLHISGLLDSFCCIFIFPNLDMAQSIFFHA